MQGVRPAPAWVTDRMTQGAPDLYFRTDSHVPGRQERRKLTQIIPALQSVLHDYQDLVIVIEGYGDDSPRAEYNERIALERAGAVRRSLLSYSFPEERLMVAGFSCRDTERVAQREMFRRENRRVHFRAACICPQEETTPRDDAR